MANWKNLMYHGSDTVPKDFVTFEVNGILGLNYAYNDPFNGGFLPIWTTVSSNIEDVTTANSKLTILLDAGAPNSFELESVDSPVDDAVFDVDFDFGINEVPTLEDIKIGMTRGPNLSFGVVFKTDGTCQAVLEMNDATYIGSVFIKEIEPALRYRFRFIYNSIGTVAMLMRSGEKWLTIFDKTGFALSAASFDTFYIYSDDGNSSYCYYNGITYFPLVSGIEDRRYTGGPLCMEYRAGVARFDFQPALPGSHLFSIIHPTYYPSVVEPENVINEIVVANHSLKSDDTTMFVGQAEIYYTDAEEYYNCPLFADPNDDNRGGIIISNVCFNDGSDLDNDFVGILFPMSCDTSLADRQKNPAFVVEDSGNKYGYDFDFKRLHNPVDDIHLTSGRYFRNLKSLVLKDGRRFYYGVTSELPATNHEIWIKWHIDSDGYDVSYALYSLDNLSSPVDSGSFIDGVNTYSSITDSSLRYNLPQGRYYFECSKIFLDPANEISMGMGSTPGSNMVCKFQEISNTDESNYSSVRLYFDVKEYTGSLAYFFYDPSNGALTPVAEPLVSILCDTESISAVENDDGVAVIYKKFNSNVYSSRSSYLRFRNITESGMSSERVLFIPRLYGANSFVHAFDAVSFSGKLFLFASIESDRQSFQGMERYWDGEGEAFDETIMIRRWAPFVSRGFEVFSCDMSGVDFNAAITAIRDFNRSTIPLLSLEAFYSNYERNYGYLQPHSAPNLPLFTGSEAYLAADRISVSPDEEFGVMCVSIIDMHHRKPTIFLGSDMSYKEISVPDFFNLSYGSPLILANFESLSSCLAIDGMIHSVATTRSADRQSGSPSNVSELPYIEFGIIDPKLFTSDRQKFFTRNPAITSGGIFSGVNSYKPEFSFMNMPWHVQFSGFDTPDVEKWNGASYDLLDNPLVTYNYTQTSAYISRDRQFSIVCLGQPLSRNGLIYQNGMLDNFPMKTICIESFTQEAEDFLVKTAAIVTDDYYSLRNSIVESSIKRTLNIVSQIRDYHIKGDIGYRFKTVAKVIFDTAVPVEPLFIESSFISGEPLGQSLMPAQDFTRLRARFAVYDDRAICQYYDVDTSGWEDVGEISISENVYYEFYIFSHNYDGNLGRYLWFIKEANSAVDFDSVSLYEGFKTDTLGLVKISEVKLNQSYTTEESTIKVYFEANGVSNKDDFAYVNEIDWGLLRADVSSYSFENTTKGGAPYNEYTVIQRDGKFWNDANDLPAYSRMINHTSCPIVSGVNYFNNSGPSVYIYNGFSVQLSSGSAVAFDSYSVARYKTSDINSLSSKYLHGCWLAPYQSQDIYVWCDSQDSGKDYFDVDTFAIIGHNFFKFSIVGKNNILDDWELIEEVDCSKHRIDGYIYSDGGDKFIIQRDGMNLIRGDIKDELYIYSNGKSYQVFDINSDHIVANTLNDPLSSVSLYPSRYVLKTDQIKSYRFLGIKIIQPEQTAEGYLRLYNFDFGYSDVYPIYGLDDGGGVSVESSANVEYIHDDQAYSFKIQKPIGSIELDYSLQDGQDYIRMASMMDSVDVSRRPIYVIPNYASDRHSVFLTILDGGIKTEILVDEDEDEVYSVSMKLMIL
jgi:hypothetical protein